MVICADKLNLLKYVCMALLILSVSLPALVLAEEGGVGHYYPGSVANLLDAAPTKPGYTLYAGYMHYEGDYKARKDLLPISGYVAGKLDANADAVIAGCFYTFEERVAAAWYSVGLFVPYVWMDVEATVYSKRLGSVRRKDTADGIGDITLTPLIMAWEYDYFQFDTLMMIYAPTGDYDEGRLANPGLNHWTFDPTVGIAYNHDELGFNAAIHSGIAMSTENQDTDYRNGEVWHMDASVQQLLPAGKGYAGVGANAFYYEQISDDNGRGSQGYNLKSKTMGVGPVLTYLLPIGENLLAAEFSWLPELDTQKRLEGDYFWMKVVYQF